MRRSAALPLLVANLTALLAVALPAGPAAACSEAVPVLTASREVVTAGSSVTLSGEDVTGPGSGCTTPVPPMVPPTPAQTASPTPSESTPPPVESVPPQTIAPSSTAPVVETSLPLVKVAYAAPAATSTVTVTIVRATDYWSETGTPRTIGTGTATSARVPGRTYTRHTYSGTVTIPAGLAPGGYRLAASSPDAFFGYALVRVVATLPDTGRPTGAVARLGALLVLAGAGAVALGRRGRGAHAAR